MPPTQAPSARRPRPLHLAALLAPLALSACGSGSGGSGGPGDDVAPPSTTATLLAALTDVGLVDVDAATGDLSPRTPDGRRGLPGIESLAHVAAAGVLYAVDLDLTGLPEAPTGRLVRIDTDDGSIEIVGAIGRNDVKNLAWDATSATLFGTTSGVEELVTIDPSTAEVSIVGPLEEAGTMRPIALDSLTVEEGGGALFGVEMLGSKLYRVDPSDATATLVGDIGSSFVTGLAYDTVNDRLLGIASLDERLLSIDPLTAATTTVGTIFGTSPLALRAATFDTSLFRLYVVDAIDDTLALVEPGVAAYARVQQLALANVDGLGWRSDGRAVAADRTSGAIALIDPTQPGFETLGWSGFDDLTALTVHPVTDEILAIDGGSDALLRIDGSTGVGTAIGTLGFDDVESLTWNGAGTTLYAVGRTTRLLLEVDPGTGAATAVATLPIGTQVVGLTWDPTTDELIALRNRPNDLVVVDPATGSVLGKDSPALSFARSITVEGDAGTALVPSFTAQEMLRLDLATGVLSGVAGYGFAQRNGLAVDHDSGTIYAFDAISREILVIDPTSGIPYTLSYAGFGALGGLAYDTELEVLWAHQAGLYAIDPDTGLSQVVGGSSSTVVSGLAFDPDGAELYGVTEGDEPRLVRFDRTTGDVTQIAIVGTAPMEGLCFDPASGRLYATEPSTRTLVELDPATGARFVVGPTAEAVDALGGPFGQ